MTFIWVLGNQLIFYEKGKIATFFEIILKRDTGIWKGKFTSLWNWILSLLVTVAVWSLSNVWLFGTPWTTACQASLSSPFPRVYSNSCPLSQWSHPPFSSFVVLFFSHLQGLPSSIRVFSNMSVLPIRWPKYWSFSFNVSPSNEYSGLTSFRIDSLDLLSTVLSNTTVQKHQFFSAQLSL